MWLHSYVLGDTSRVTAAGDCILTVLDTLLSLVCLRVTVTLFAVQKPDCPSTSVPINPHIDQIFIRELLCSRHSARLRSEGMCQVTSWRLSVTPSLLLTFGQHWHPDPSQDHGFEDSLCHLSRPGWAAPIHRPIWPGEVCIAGQAAAGLCTWGLVVTR